MGIGVSIFLIAVGAILTFAVHVVVSGLDLNAVGVILMIVGGAGLLLSLFVIDSWGWRRSMPVASVARPVASTPTVVQQERVVREY
jgi:hypothetical protein